MQRLVLSLVLSLFIGPLGPLALPMAAFAQAAPSPTAGNLINITADHQHYDQDHRKYNLKGRVVVKYKDYTISSDLADVDLDDLGDPKLATFLNRPTVRRVKPGVAGEDNVVGDVVKVFLGDNIFGAEGNVESYIATVAAAPFLIHSDAQVIDNNQKIMTATGKVRVDYKDGTGYSSQALLRMNAAGKADRVIFSGGARLVKPDGEMTGSRITIEVNSGNLYAENDVKTMVVMKDNADGPDKVWVYSDYQNYDKAAGKMLANGHVKIIYGDYTATGPKATFNIINGTVDKIYLTGRPTIVEKARRVTADKITITTNPKNFDAVGNVQTQFQTQNAGKPAAKTPPPQQAAAPAKSGKKPAEPFKPAPPAKKPAHHVVPENPLDFE